MITTQQLAKLAGVSQSTVSRSLSDSQDISQQTRLRIQTLAQQQGYVPRKRSVPRRSVEKKAICIILSQDFLGGTLDFYVQTLLNSLYSAIDRENYYSILLVDHSNPQSISQIENVIRTGTVAGFILIIMQHNHDIEQCLQQQNTPHIYTQYFSRPLQKSMNIADLDHYTGGYMAAEHLISLGHRAVGTLTGEGSDFTDRTAGFVAALREKSILTGISPVLHVGSTYDDGYAAVEKHFGQLQLFTGIFAQTDMLALGCMARLAEKGVRVPEDCSIIGFDGIQAGLRSRPPLTTIEQPIPEITSMTMNRLLRLISHGDTKVTHSFAQPTLLVRSSTAPPSRQDKYPAISPVHFFAATPHDPVNPNEQ